MGEDNTPQPYLVIAGPPGTSPPATKLVPVPDNIFMSDGERAAEQYPDVQRLPPDTGPWRVVTEMAVFDFDEDTRRMRLRGLAPWVTVDDVLAQMEFEPLIAPSLEALGLPSDEELAALRAEVDPTGRTIRGRWITVTEDDGRFRLVEEQAAGVE